MKRRLIAILMLLCLMSAAVVERLPVQADAAEVDAHTYYYDHLSERQQECYDILVTIYAELPNKTGEEQRRFTTMLPDNPTEADYVSLGVDFIAADMALKADQPMYQWVGRVSGYGFSAPGEMTYFSLHIASIELPSDEMEAQALARLQQIVDTVGSGDRYTKLRKMTHYLLSNVFYDPYLDLLNMGGNFSFSTIGHHYDTSPYGVLLKNISICEGFSQAVKVLCDAIGVPCIIIGNHIHAWNLVQMEDGKWYKLDITNACTLGWDGNLPNSLEVYFQQVFLNNSAFGVADNYRDPYMINVDGVYFVTEFPAQPAGQYKYTGSTKDFSYTVVPSTYTPGEPNFVYEVNPDGKTCTITRYEGKESGDLTIPETIDGYTVTAIGPYAFYYCTGFNGKLTIPDTVQTIGWGAFAGCYGLTAAKFPADLRKIDTGAFAGCKGLREVELPDLLSELGTGAFYDCAKLESASFGSHILTVSGNAFGNPAKSLTISAPAGSAMERYADENGIRFTAAGNLCSFEDADGDWEYDDNNHFHTCAHGVQFDATRHAIDMDYATCGDTCLDCGAEYCHVKGFMVSVKTIQNPMEANCIDGAYTGDIVCVCGNFLDIGQFVGEPNDNHIGGDGLWKVTEDYHYHLCACGDEIDVQPHSGGEKDENGQAICSVCGKSYTVKEATTETPAEENDFPWLIVAAVGAGVVLAAVVVLLLILKKKKTQ